MKLKDLQRGMKNRIFSVAQARILCRQDNKNILNLQLHQWVKKGDLISLKRGLYMFIDADCSAAEISRNLYYPCYFSLEYALNFYGIMTEAVFQYTLVSTKATRRFETPVGVFNYQKIKKEAFTGFDEETMMANKEKALVDYFYLNSAKLEPSDAFWESSRLEAVTTKVDFKKALNYANLFKSKKVNLLLNSFHSYAKSQQNCK